MINSKEKVELRKIEPHFLSFPYLLRLILTLYYTLSESNPPTMQNSTTTAQRAHTSRAQSPHISSTPY
jgi:hypothetical protein